ncbi:hypothetical protein B0H14DRAFT_3138960 [Mycena olivaceomarginata]|nr:hypothetical protein B0H14DRAFT_3138960 [Mycena olivaceomarginata]
MPSLRRCPTRTARRSRAQQRTTPKITSTSKKRRSSTALQVRQHKRLCTEIPIELSALLIRRAASKALQESYAAGEMSHEAHPPPIKARRRSPLIPNLKSSRSFHPPIELTTAIPEPNPYSNMWRTVCRKLFLRFEQNPAVLTGSARFPVGPISGLNDIFPPITEFTPKVGNSNGQILGDPRRSKCRGRQYQCGLGGSKSWIMSSCHRQPMAPFGEGILRNYGNEAEEIGWPNQLPWRSTGKLLVQEKIQRETRPANPGPEIIEKMPIKWRNIQNAVAHRMKSREPLSERVILLHIFKRVGEGASRS